MIIQVVLKLFSRVAFAQEKDDKSDVYHKFVIVGGGSGGIAVAAQLSKKLNNKEKDIAIIEPKKVHYYQPLWTMVGGGIFTKEESVRDESTVIPPATKWIKDSVKEFLPDENTLVTHAGQKVSYDYLVVATGIELNLDGVKGLRNALGKDGVSTNYHYDYVDKTWEFIKNFRGGTMLFTYPEGAVKCGGAPQKIMWLAEDHLRKSGIRDKSQVVYALPAATMFSVKKYSDMLDVLRKQRGIDVKFKHVLVEVKPDSKEAILRNLDDGSLKSVQYDFLHVTPPMGPPEVIRRSPLAASNGYVDVDKHTLQHNKYKNVFSLGDVANLPTSKTIAAITLQAPTVVANLLSITKNQPLKAKYNGYTSCPIVTGYNSLILAEFLYDNVPKETFPINQAIPRWTMYFLKEKVFPTAYWNLFLTGRWYGPNTIFEPKYN